LAYKRVRKWNEIKPEPEREIDGESERRGELEKKKKKKKTCYELGMSLFTKDWPVALPGGLNISWKTTATQ
jgi:hypothetical protein